MESWQSVPHDNVIKQMKARAAQKHKESECLGNSAACNSQRSLQQRNDEKHTVYAIKITRNGLRIIL